MGETAAALDPNERSAMVLLAGLLAMSASGAKSTLKPRSRRYEPMLAAMLRA